MDKRGNRHGGPGDVSPRRRARRRSQPAGRAASSPLRLARAWPWCILALFLLALVWRLAYLNRLAGSPLVTTLHSDEQVYWDWSTWLVEHRFRGTHPFFMSPLYPYFLALVRPLVGSQVLAVLRVQALLGAAAVVLLTDAARRLTRPWVALALGAALSLYEMSVLFDGLILGESLLFFLESLLVWLWCCSLRVRPGRAWQIACGILIGLIAQGRPTGALLLVPALSIAALARTATRRPPLARGGVLVAAFVLTSLPSLIWNWSASREWIPFTYSGGYNLYVGNNPDANGGFVWIAGGDRLVDLVAARTDGGGDGDGREYLARTLHMELTPGQSSAYWANEALGFIRRNPGRSCALAGRKLLLFLNKDEVLQIEVPEEYGRLAGPLGLPIIGTFALVGGLGMIGFAMSRTTPAIDRALRLYVIAVIVGTLPFFVTDRYRWHLIPALAVLAAGAVETAVVAWATRPRRGIGRMGLAVAGAAVVIALPIVEAQPALEEFSIARDLGMRYAGIGRDDLAIEQFERAVQLERELGSQRDRVNWGKRDRAVLHFNYGVALHRVGRDGDALSWLETATEEAPENARFLRTLADAYFAQGRAHEGDSVLRRIGQLEGGTAQMLLSEGWRAARSGRLEDAERQFRSAVDGDPQLYGAWGALIRVQVERGALARAESTLTSAEHAGMPKSARLAHEALVDAASGRDEAARKALGGIPEAALADPTLGAVVATSRRILQARRP